MLYLSVFRMCAERMMEIQLYLCLVHVYEVYGFYGMNHTRTCLTFDVCEALSSKVKVPGRKASSA